RQNHIVQPLIRSPRDRGLLANDVEVFGERSHPILSAELIAVLTLCNQGDNIPSVAHLISPVSDYDRAGCVILCRAFARVRRATRSMLVAARAARLLRSYIVSISGILSHFKSGGRSSRQFSSCDNSSNSRA